MLPCPAGPAGARRPPVRICRRQRAPLAALRVAQPGTSSARLPCVALTGASDVAARSGRTVRAAHRNRCGRQAGALVQPAAGCSACGARIAHHHRRRRRQRICHGSGLGADRDGVGPAASRRAGGSPLPLAQRRRGRGAGLGMGRSFGESATLTRRPERIRSGRICGGKEKTS